MLYKIKSIVQIVLMLTALIGMGILDYMLIKSFAEETKPQEATKVDVRLIECTDKE